MSFVNPHDISYYPGFYPPYEPLAAGSQGNPYNPFDLSDMNDFQPAYSSVPTSIVSSVPSPWNYESTVQLTAKSVDVTGTTGDGPNFLQPFFQHTITDAACNYPNPHLAPPILASGAYQDFLNWYYYMVSLVDTQIGNVLSAALPGYSPSGSANPSANTTILFLSDHGEYGGSHGLHAKGGAVYDEALRVPLYVCLPSQSSPQPLYQMCSMVDIFKLVVELALGHTYNNWAGDAVYKDQALNQNQSIFSFIQDNSLNETRFFKGASGKQYAYILTTTDETLLDRQHYKGIDPNTGKDVTVIDCFLRNHVMCLRTKSEEDHSNPASAYTGGKLALYGRWPLTSPPTYAHPVIDASISVSSPIVQDYEYYDYVNYQNRAELGNDYVTALTSADGHGIAGSGPGAHVLLTDLRGALGNMAMTTGGSSLTPATGLASTVLTRTLSGIYKGNNLSGVTLTAIIQWYGFLYLALNKACKSMQG